MDYILYLIVALLWGIFATRMHLKLHRKNKAWVCFILNSIFCPIAMVMAIKNCPIK